MEPVNVVKMRAYNFLKSLPYQITPEGFKHYLTILDIIYEKFMNPEKPESNFVTLCFNEDWEKAKYVADDRNKEALQYHIIQDFVKYIKKCPEYIQKNRQDKLILLMGNQED